MKARRRFQLADANLRDLVNFTEYEDMILEAIQEIVPDCHPVIKETYFEIDDLPQSQRIAIGRILSKADKMGKFGKTVEQFRLFQGKLITAPPADMNDSAKKDETAGGHQ